MTAISNQKNCKCKQHNFIMKPLKQNLHHSRKVQVCLCQGLSKSPRKKFFSFRRKCCVGYPILNTDKNYATPAFILQSQKEHFLENRNIYLKDHSRKTREYEQEATDLYFPAPKSNYDYCNVCCTTYTDYIQHISSPQHYRHIKNSKFNEYILELEKGFQQKINNKNPKRSVGDRIIVIEDDEDLNGSGRKKLKSEQRSEKSDHLNYGSELGFPLNHYHHLNNFINPDPKLNCSFFQNGNLYKQIPETFNFQSPHCRHFNQSYPNQYQQPPTNQYLAFPLVQFQNQANYMSSLFPALNLSLDFQDMLANNNQYPVPHYANNMQVSCIPQVEPGDGSIHQAGSVLDQPYFCFNNFNFSTIW